MIFSVVTAIFVLLSLFVSSLLVNGLQILSLSIFPFSKIFFRKLNCHIAALWWSYCVFCIEDICKIKIVITGDSLAFEENAIVIANHQEMPDIFAILCLAYHSGRIADLKWFAKNPLKYIPGFGWGMFFIDCIFLKRNWMKDQNSVLKTFEKLRKHQSPFWIISFPEGTRATTEKILKAQEYAKNRGITPLKHLLIPRTKGFIATSQGLENEFHAVYDLTIGFEGTVPNLFSFFLSPTKSVHIQVTRYEKENIPKELKLRSKWLQDRFFEKDQKMDYFFQHQHFPQ